MKAFTVYWKDSIKPKGEKYEASAVVIAMDIQDCMSIAMTYGEVTSIHSEKDTVITQPKTEVPA